MFLCLLRTLRNAYHPLHLMRKIPAFRSLINLVDILIWVKLYRIDWRVRIRSVRNASYLLSQRTIEPEIVALFCAIDDLFQPSVFWDVGANIGYYGWLMKSRHRSISVMMVEPDPDNAAMLRDTIDRRTLPDIEVVEAAVSDQPGLGMFALDRISGATGSLTDSGPQFNAVHYGAASEVIPVETVRLDDLGTPEARPDFVKIDVEGHEHAALAGAADLIEHDQPIFILECFHGHEQATSSLVAAGYTMLDAERMTPDLSQATNFLALPPQLASEVDRLTEAWRRECQTLGV